MEREMEIVAWMDDGSHVTDGSGYPLVRVVTDKTRSHMPWRAVAAYEVPLVTQASATDDLALLEKRIGVLTTVLERIRDDQTWRSADNTIWPAVCAALAQTEGR